MALLTAAFVLHVLSAAFWTGSTLYVVYAVVPAARTGRLSTELFVDNCHRLLLITRWTGVVIPLTGAYMIWVLYTPLELLTATARGWAVLVMIGLWGGMNALIELGVLRMRRAVDDVGLAAYMTEGFPSGTLSEPPSSRRPELVGLVRPYLLGAAGCAVLLLVDAALLAGGGV